jgi:hypothetical protein
VPTERHNGCLRWSSGDGSRCSARHRPPRPMSVGCSSWMRQAIGNGAPKGSCGAAGLGLAGDNRQRGLSRANPYHRINERSPSCTARSASDQRLPSSPWDRRAAAPWAHVDAGSGSLPPSARNAPSGKSPCGTHEPHTVGRGSGGHQTASTRPAICQHDDTRIVKRLDFNQCMA